jgi:hypothetical protein
MIKKDGGLVNELKTFYKVTDKRVIMEQIKLYIQAERWDDLESFVDKHQKKYNLPVELIADRVMYKSHEIGIKMLCKMPNKNKDEKYLLLQRIGKLK